MDEYAEERHRALMRAVLEKIGREQLLLKGGTALMFGYEIPRFSGDLDFDANKPVRGLEKKIKEVAVENVTITSIDVKKNTDTKTKYRINYTTAGSSVERHLKIEISYRQRFDENEDVMTIDGIRFASLPRIIDQKLLASYDGKDPRTAARDVFDFHFLSWKYQDSFTPDLAQRLTEFIADPELVYSRYAEAYAEEDIGVTDEELQDMLLELHENAQTIFQQVNQRTGETTVKNLCKFAGIDYAPKDEKSRKVELMRGGRHQRISVPGRPDDRLIVDLDEINHFDQQERTIMTLQVLAVELDCKEAGESLISYGLVKLREDGKYERKNRENDDGR